MVEEPDVSLPTEEPRICPVCGTRVAAMATTCLMCGASLTAEAPAAEPAKETRRGLPAWARPLVVVLLALMILAAGLYGFYALMGAQPPEDLTPTATPTSTSTPSPTPTATPTPPPTLPPTPLPPLTHQVQGGDTLSAIAGQYQTTVADILALNPDVQAESLQVGLVLLIPAGPLTPTPTATLDPSLPTPTPGNFAVHTVAPGETLGTIAEAYDVSVALIREVNNLPLGDDTIFTNQSLVIPLGTPIPSPTLTPDLNATPTPVPPYAAPALLSPPDGATLAGDQQPVVLQWTSVSVLREDEWYAVTLSQSGGDADPSTHYTRATAWRVPFNGLLSAKDAAGEFFWQVQVVREAKDRDGKRIYQDAGLPGEERSFTWLAPTPTPAPTDTPSPAAAP